MNVQIACPDCTTTIELNPTKLIQGNRFTCSNCKLVVSLAEESRSVVEETLTEFQKIQTQKARQNALT